MYGPKTPTFGYFFGGKYVGKHTSPMEHLGLPNSSWTLWLWSTVESFDYRNWGSALYPKQPVFWWLFQLDDPKSLHDFFTPSPCEDMNYGVIKVLASCPGIRRCVMSSRTGGMCGAPYRKLRFHRIVVEKSWGKSWEVCFFTIWMSGIHALLLYCQFNMHIFVQSTVAYIHSIRRYYMAS